MYRRKLGKSKVNNIPRFVSIKCSLTFLTESILEFETCYHHRYITRDSTTTEQRKILSLVFAEQQVALQIMRSPYLLPVNRQGVSLLSSALDSRKKEAVTSQLHPSSIVS